MTVEERLERIESMLCVLVERQQQRDWYSTDQFARAVGLAEFTVREHCRLNRLKAEKRRSGRARIAHGRSRIPNCFGSSGKDCCRTGLTEDLLNRVVLRRGVKVPVTAGNLFRHVAGELLDETLVDAVARAALMKPCRKKCQPRTSDHSVSARARFR